MLTLQCEIHVTSEALVIDYQIRNGNAHDLGVFNWIQARNPDGTWLFSNRTAHVERNADELLVRHMALPLPSGMRVTAYVAPPATQIRSGETHVQQISLPIPVRVMQPYRAALVAAEKGGCEVTADERVSVKSVRFEVGVFTLDRHCFLISEHPAYPDVLSASVPAQAVAQQVVHSHTTTLDSPIEVLDYRGAPWS